MIKRNEPIDTRIVFFSKSYITSSVIIMENYK